MKVLRKTAGGAGYVGLCEVPVPEIGPNDVLMKVYAHDPVTEWIIARQTSPECPLEMLIDAAQRGPGR